MNTWSLSWHGLRTVVELELKQRVRSRRWVVALAAWFLLIGAITSLVIWVSHRSIAEIGVEGSDRSWAEMSAGQTAFGVITFFVLGLALVIAPAFTATSINGDRSAGTLASLQATRLSALELAAGKLIAAWSAAAVFLLVSLPFFAWTMVLGSISVWQLLVTFLAVCVEVAVVSALGLGWSAMLSRSAGSTVLSYLSVVGIAIISPIVFALVVSLSQHEQEIRVWGLTEADDAAYSAQVDTYWQQEPDGENVPAPPFEKCTWVTKQEYVTRSDQSWWLLVPNPFVIVADAAPLPQGGTLRHTSGVGPLTAISYAVRMAAMPPATERDDCIQLYNYAGQYNLETADDGTIRVTTSSGVVVNVDTPVKARAVNVDTPIWPWGLAVNLVLGGVFFWIAVRRLAVPYGVLAPGTRIA